MSDHRLSVGQSVTVVSVAGALPGVILAVSELPSQEYLVKLDGADESYFYADFEVELQEQEA